MAKINKCNKFLALENEQDKQFLCAEMKINECLYYTRIIYSENANLPKK